MNSTHTDAAGVSPALSNPFFKRFLVGFHILILGTMAILLIPVLLRVQHAGGIGPKELALVVMVLAQIGLYFRRFWNLKKVPLSAWAWYFGLSFALCFLEWKLRRSFGWMTAVYIGQMAGLLPIRYSLPACGLAWLVFDPPGFGVFNASLPRSFDEMMDVLSKTIMFSSWVVLGLFIRHLADTSNERGRLIVELQNAQRELELARERELELAALRERERLARDLHDTLGHSLVTLTVQLEAAQRLQTADPARVATLLAEMQKLTRSSMEDLRRSLANLRTSGLGDRPLTESLRTLCAEAAKRFGAAIDCQVAEGADALPPAVAEVLWRVAQEGLTNIEKHAHAHRVQVNLTVQPKEVVLRVSDDGAGLSRGAEDKPGHYGLRGLRERVEGLGGAFTVAAAGTSGTLIEVRIPVIA